MPDGPKDAIDNHLLQHVQLPGLGRVDTASIARLRAQGRSWPQIAEELGCSVGKAYSAHLALSKNPVVSLVAAD